MLHLLLTLITLGLWLIPWLVLGVAGGGRRIITVDDFGTVIRERI